MQRRTFCLAAGTALFTPYLARAKGKSRITLAQAADPALEAALWPLMNGKVSSETVEFDISFVSIPATIQAISTQQYDIVVCGTNLLPRFHAQGIPLKVLSACFRYSKEGGGTRLWVAADGPVKSVEDLKGRKIGASSLAAPGVTNNRLVLSQVYGANVELEGGDFQWVELPNAVLPGAIRNENVHGALLSNAQDYAAMQDDTKALLYDANAEMRKMFNAQVPGTTMIGYEDRLNERPEDFIEANRMLDASVKYLFANQDEVFAAVAKNAGIPEEYLRWHIQYYSIPAYHLTQDDIPTIGAYWDALRKANLLSQELAPEDIIWKEVRFA